MKMSSMELVASLKFIVTFEELIANTIEDDDFDKYSEKQIRESVPKYLYCNSNMLYLKVQEVYQNSSITGMLSQLQLMLNNDQVNQYTGNYDLSVDSVYESALDQIYKSDSIETYADFAEELSEFHNHRL